MHEFLHLKPPDEARSLLLSRISTPFNNGESGWSIKSEVIETTLALGRVIAEDISAPHPLPEFSRSSVDGFAVMAADTFGASESIPAYLNLMGEVPMGEESKIELKPGQCVLIHTGGMLPKGADAIVMLEYTQAIERDRRINVAGINNSLSDENADRAMLKGEIEITRPVANGENVILAGEDVIEGAFVFRRGCRIRPMEIGGLLALGILALRVAIKPKVGIISTGDELVNPDKQTNPGQVRDINSFTLAALVSKSGGEPVVFGVVPDRLEKLKEIASMALTECDMLVITAGSSASTRDMTAEVISSLGEPGVLIHGVNTRPGKPTILGVCDNKAVIGLPGNPVSALVNGHLFVVPVIEKLLGLPFGEAFEWLRRPSVTAKLMINLSSVAGREDWWPVKLNLNINSMDGSLNNLSALGAAQSWEAEPIFGKSNLIFSLIAADGLLRIPPEVTGLNAGEQVDVVLI